MQVVRAEGAFTGVQASKVQLPAGFTAQTEMLYLVKPPGGTRDGPRMPTVAVERSTVPATMLSMVGALQDGAEHWGEESWSSIHGWAVLLLLEQR